MSRIELLLYVIAILNILYVGMLFGQTRERRKILTDIFLHDKELVDEVGDYEIVEEYDEEDVKTISAKTDTTNKNKLN